MEHRCDGTQHVISRYYGSEFMGHSRAEDMLGHFNGYGRVRHNPWPDGPGPVKVHAGQDDVRVMGKSKPGCQSAERLGETATAERQQQVTKLINAAYHTIKSEQPFVSFEKTVALLKNSVDVGSQYCSDVACRRCGEDGHFQRECENPENLRKVNKRLLKTKQPMGNFPGAQ
ncbi:hypothetical protein D5F01_LYC03386 [Larimichthys crocea]|uniref:CCHC-type domain-containing protein n=1 Tax=Larimichthys crocea TaxID=215358 RepID=A0A6G0J5J6_LARCR|nr:hypothetical protein D5F01_LYC03386 [Larimichthys crocea]